MDLKLNSDIVDRIFYIKKQTGCNKTTEYKCGRISYKGVTRPPNTDGSCISTRGEPIRGGYPNLWLGVRLIKTDRTKLNMLHRVPDIDGFFRKT